MSQGGANNVSGSGADPIETLTGNSGGAVAPDGSFNVDILGNNSTGINIVGTPASNLLTVIGLASSTTQVGTVELATAVETGTLTDATRAITPAGLEPILVTPYVVTTGGTYTTIQSAVNAANGAGGGIVYVRPGTYTEDLTLFDGIQIVTFGFSDSGDGVNIIGTHIPPLTGGFVFRNCRLSSATHIFDSAAAGSTHLIVADAAVAVTNGYLFNLPNWTGTLEMWDVNSGFGTNDGCVNNTGGSQVLCFSGSYGIGSINTMVISGNIFTDAAEFFCPLDFQTGTTLGIEHSNFYNSVTASNNSTGDISSCIFQTGASVAFTMSSSAAITISNSSIDSSNNPAVAGAGAGTLTLSDISFLDNATLAGTLTLGSSSFYPVDLANGELLIGSAGQPATAATLTAGANISITNGAGSITIAANGGGELAITALTNASTPYTVLAADEYLSCDVSGGVLTINLPNAPTTGRVVRIKDSGGDAVTNNISVTTVGGVVTIDGVATFTMNTDFESISVIFNGVGYEIF